MDKKNEIFKLLHEDDTDQLSIIFSDAPRIVVTAPAGCGKTKTLVSKISYLLLNKKICKYKKILTLTFSVNAAYKIKKSVMEIVPSITNNYVINDVHVTNFHGFARRVLSMYGYLLSEYLANLKEFRSIDDSRPETLTKLDIGVSFEEAMFISNYSQAIKDVDIRFLKNNINKYLGIVTQKFLPNNYITYNAIVLYAIQLFKKYNSIKSFYQNIYQYIIADEFQDTNILNLILLQQLISSKTNFMFMGDPLQRIYGFIGAVPNLMQKTKVVFNTTNFQLEKNYRFASNLNMLLLDKNIRENSRNPYFTTSENSIIPFYYYSSQSDEAYYLACKIKDLLIKNDTYKIAILTATRSKNLDCIINYLNNQDIIFFNALFSDESDYYTEFHYNSLEIFNNLCKKTGNNITNNLLNGVLSTVRSFYANKDLPEFPSLIRLLEVFFNHVIKEKNILNNEERYSLIIDTLASRGLKQCMEYLDERVILSTVHGAKGLEWDIVVIPDMEEKLFPAFPSLCTVCYNKCNINGIVNKCDFDRTKCDSVFWKKYIETLSVFYVAVTRAKKQVFFSASKTCLDKYGAEIPTRISCLLSLSGLSIQQLSTDFD